MSEIQDKDCHIAEECKVTIKKKQSAAAQRTLPDMLDFDSFLIESSVFVIQKN